jgi:hypothetical protein
MQVFVVTRKKCEFNECGRYGGYYCYLLGFARYRNCRPEGYVFWTGCEALNFMLANGKVWLK